MQYMGLVKKKKYHSEVPKHTTSNIDPHELVNQSACVGLIYRVTVMGG